jgi:hypothetical protein
MEMVTPVEGVHVGVYAPYRRKGMPSNDAKTGSRLVQLPRLSIAPLRPAQVIAGIISTALAWPETNVP